MQDLQGEIAANCWGSINHMLLHHTTATNAARDIQDDNMRDVVTNELIVGQIIALLTFLKDLRLIDKAKCDEFTAYLQRNTIFQPDELTRWISSQ